MVTLQWASKVEIREKNGEGSAWLARLGAPARQNRRASVEEGMNHEIHEIHERGIIEPRMDTNGHEYHLSMKLCH